MPYRLVSRYLSKIAGVKDVAVDTNGFAKIITDRPIEKNELKNALVGTDYDIK